MTEMVTNEVVVTVYERVGGTPTFDLLARAFYARVAQDPVLRPLYPPHLDCATQSLARYLAQFFGGPDEYSRRRSRPSLREAHARFRIRAAERDAWLQAMTAALDDVELAEPAKGAMRRYFAESSAFLINCPAASEAEPAAVAAVDGSEIACEVARRWEEQRAYEDLVTAVLDRNIPRALALADDDRIKRLSDREPATHLTILSVLGGSGEPELLNRVEARVRTEPGLVTERFGGGRTLLHEAAGQWAPAFARLLLSLGADPNAEDEFGHAPLYCAGNHFLRRGSTSETDAAELVRVLAEAGANVNHAGGSKACTPLHMAARQGHVALAEALLDRGADREACDSVGDTPLRRAVNCGKVPMAAFLLQRGADPNSRGSRKLTPVQAARGKQMRELFDR